MIKAPTKEELMAEYGVAKTKKRKKPCVHRWIREVETSTSTPSYAYEVCARCGKVYR